MDVYLEDLIAENYDDLLNDVLDHGHSRYILAGGRGSLKSSFVGFAIVLLMVQPGNENIHAICFRKTANTLRDSVYGQILFAIDKLGLQDEFTSRVSPMKIIRKSTRQEIIFRGMDDPMKLKSIKLQRGYIGISWFEEADTFSGMYEIRNVMQSVRRGGDRYWTFMSFNPPATMSNFMNEYVMESGKEPDLFIHRSTYETVPREWLGDQFIYDAESLKRTSPRAYAHEYLGEITGTGGEVFENLRIEEITDEQIQGFEWIYMGIDWGWYPDPFHWSKMAYDANRHMLYIFDEYRANKQSNAETWQYLKTVKGVRDEDVIIADSAEPKSIGDYYDFGSSCYGVRKGPDSVKYSMKWLQSLAAIVIDPVRCPSTAWEFSHYEYERTKDGEVISAYPDKDNHSIDSVRYAMSSIWQLQGQ